MEYICNNLEETKALATHLAKSLTGKKVFAFCGGMGVGKTTFISEVIRALGYKGYASSPTFNIVNVYNLSLNCYHFDLFRITSDEDLLSTGFYDYLEDDNGVLFLEWSENLEELPENTTVITIESINETARKFTVEGPFCEF